jgi:hypothetical protein
LHRPAPLPSNCLRSPLNYPPKQNAQTGVPT